MFVISTTVWPAVVEVLRPAADGKLVPYTCVHGTIKRGEGLRRCARCEIMLLAGPAYHDAAKLRVWHEECLLLDVRAHCAPDALDHWEFHRIVWDH